MAQLYRTNLVIVSSPLPADFIGKPQDFYDAMVERLEIQSPSGTQFFVVGDTEPSTNQGPWLKGGSKWYVFSTSAGKYVPQDISDSITSLFTVSATTPAGPVSATDPTIWLRVLGTRVIGWYFWDGSTWRPGGNVPPSGPTSSRPTNPQDLEQFFDSDISCMLHWERGAWRTISGSPGDIKFVTSSTLATALVNNPGWSYLAEANQAWRSTSLGVASKDVGSNPSASYSVASGHTQRAPGDVVGEETHVLTDAEMVQHTHLIGALTALNSDNNVYFYRVDNGDNFTAPAPVAPNYAQVNGDSTTNATKTGALPSVAAGTMLVTSAQLTIATAPAYSKAAVAHNTLPPTVFFWALSKD